MKRFLTILLTTLALTAALCVTASASSFDGAASELSAIGMFKGGANGFDLDKAPTRAQAAIMLVRLYGAEDEAKAAYDAGGAGVPLEDVSDTAKPHVAWLVEKGLANGTSATTFGGGDACSAKAYTIFLLRALGYQDGADFTTANAQEFAMGLGLLDTSAFTGKFLRDNLVALTYQALGTDVKDGGTYLLDSLVKAGAIDAASAKPITDKIEAYPGLQASGAASSQGLDASIDAIMDMSVSLKGTDGGTSMDMTQKVEAAVKGRIQMVLDKDVQMAMDMTVTASDGEIAETEKMEYWLKDGTAYVRTGEEAYQMPVGIGVDMDALMALVEQSTGKTYTAMLPFVDSISVKTSGGDTVYTMTLNDAFSGMFSGLVDQFTDILAADTGENLEMGMAVSLDGSTVAYTVGKDGTLKSAVADMTMKADVNASNGADTLALKMSVDMDMAMEIEAMGKAVKISFPDFSGFAQMIGGADGPTAILGTVVPA